MSKRLDYNEVAPGGVKALGDGVDGYVAQSALPAACASTVVYRAAVFADQQLRVPPVRSTSSPTAERQDFQADQ